MPRPLCHKLKEEKTPERDRAKKQIPFPSELSSVTPLDSKR